MNTFIHLFNLPQNAIVDNVLCQNRLYLGHQNTKRNINEYTREIGSEVVKKEEFVLTVKKIHQLKEKHVVSHALMTRN